MGLEAKLNKSGRKWKENQGNISYRYAELFFENCGVSLDEAVKARLRKESELFKSFALQANGVGI